MKTFICLVFKCYSMVAIRYGELLENDFIEYDDRYEINHFVKIHKDVKIEPFVVIDEDVEIGANTVIGPFTQIRPNVKIGENCHIGGNTVLEGDITIGDTVRLGTHSNLGHNTRIGNNTFIGNYFVPANDRLIDWPKTKKVYQPEPTIIGNNVKIGLKVTLLPGITIEDNAFIGAGTFVTRNIEKGERV